MRLSYANWQLALLTTLLMSALSAELWLHSDLRLKQQIAGHRWSYQRENHGALPLPSLILDTPISRRQESGSVRLLSNGMAQIEIMLRLSSPQHSAEVGVALQGNWQVTDGFLMFETKTYSALPLNRDGNQLLAQNGQFLEDIWRTLFNRSRPLYRLDAQHLLLGTEENALWLLTRQDVPPAAHPPMTPRLSSD